MKSRQQSSYEIRLAAAEMARARSHPSHSSNGDEQRFRRSYKDKKSEKIINEPNYIGSFTKCLPHDINGFLETAADFDAFVRAIDSGKEADIAAIPIGPGFMAGKLNWKHTYPADKEPEVRAWESMGAGLTYDLEGPDSHAVTMPPAPGLKSQELIAEMAEVYWMALCRDVPFCRWESDPLIQQARASLSHLAWFRGDGDSALRESTDALASSRARRRVMVACGGESIPLNTLFRGVGPGDAIGPYVSQFLLIGNRGVRPGDCAHKLIDGRIAYGAIRADQRVRIAKPKDFMLCWNEWLDVQNGAKLGDRAEFEVNTVDEGYRFISRPRDLATYVHFDALYEAYLNACLILMGLGAPKDPGLPFSEDALVDKQDAFAQFGGPHILTLVTEVATRALKAVRYQKFNIHRRPRPEAVGGLLERCEHGSCDTNIATHEDVRARVQPVAEMLRQLSTDEVGLKNALPAGWLLPMAFPEGSPAHPSYGAGHATVAGACVTILKAWFDHGWELRDEKGDAILYAANHDGSGLESVNAAYPNACLTVEGELNKLAANIAIGRDWAGVHYFTDYYESFRIGEAIAIGLLEEQKLTYGENFSMTVPRLDGTTVRI